MSKAPAKPTAKQSPTNKNWNVMVYMAADNSLSEECVFSLKELQRVGTAPTVNAIAQFHPSVKKPVPKRYTIKKQLPAQKGFSPSFLGDADGDLHNPIHTKDVPPLKRPKGKGGKAGSTRLSASNPAVLEAFLISSITNQPTPEARQMVILAGHGSGAVGEFLRSNNPVASLSVPELQTVLLKVREHLGRKLDIVLMDSCLMSMAEVAYELREDADLLIGAEGFELSTGWPYHRILETLNGQGQDSSQKLARDLVNKYVLYYSDYDVAGVSVDQAVCDLTRSQALADAVAALGKALSQGIKVGATLNAVLLAHWRAQSYNAEQYVDLWDFCDQLSQCCVDDKIASACVAVKQVIEGDTQLGLPPFVLHSDFSGAAFQHSHGVSIYLPWATETRALKDFPQLKQYRQLAFHKATGWGKFVGQYLQASRGPLRIAKGHATANPECFIPTDDTRFGFRLNDPLSRGGSGTVAKVKNPPVEFFR